MHSFPLAPGACLILALLCVPAHAENTSTASSASASAPACVEVEVNGVRSQSFACLTDKLTPPASAQNGKPPSPSTSEQIVNQPGNQLGVFNRAALSNRMGNTLGTSVYPQHSSANSR